MHESTQADAPRDPVCGMSVDPATARHYDHAGNTYYFCSQHCYDRFSRDPEAVLNPSEEPETPPAGSTYTCPMHPEIEQDSPGDCPKCGMALEPIAGGGDGEDQELKIMSRRFWVSVPLSTIVLLLAMSEMVPGLGLGQLLGSASGWIQALLALPVVVWAGGFAFVRGWKSVRNLSPNMWTLISLGVGAAYGFSLFALIFPDLLPEAFKSDAGHAPLYFEAAAVIISLVLLGQVMEARARGQTSRAL